MNANLDNTTTGADLTPEHIPRIRTREELISIATINYPHLVRENRWDELWEAMAITGDERDEAEAIDRDIVVIAEATTWRLDSKLGIQRKVYLPK